MRPLQLPSAQLGDAEFRLTSIRRSFVFFHENFRLIRELALTKRRYSYREYNSTISCSLTIGWISSRDGMRATLPLRASRSTVSQSGTGTIWVNSRLRKASCRVFGLSFTETSSPAFTL